MRTLFLLIFGLAFIGFAVAYYTTPIGTQIADRVEALVTGQDATPPRAATRGLSEGASNRELRRAQRRTARERRKARRQQLRAQGREETASMLDTLKIVLDGLNLLIGVLGLYFGTRALRRRDA